MSCSIVKVNGEPNSTLLMEYIMDSEADVSSLPVNVADGSFSYTKDLSCIYVFKGGSWVKADGIEVDPNAIAEAVAAWLDDHPEATTTVQDGAISYAKLNSSLKGTVDDVGVLKTAIGDSAMGTTATTVTGAIAEHESEITSLNGAVGSLEAGSLSALNASLGDVPVAGGDGAWSWLSQGYVTPEMFGAKGDGTTDDTQAIRDMIASGAMCMWFDKAQYKISGSIDFTTDHQTIIFSNTQILLRHDIGAAPITYGIGFKAQMIKTIGKLRVDSNRHAYICIYCSGISGCEFDDIMVTGAIIWGVYFDHTSGVINNTVTFGFLRANSCGLIFSAKGKKNTNSNKILDITNIDYSRYTYIHESEARVLFNGEYEQNAFIVDDSDYVIDPANTNNRFIMGSPIDAALTLDEQDVTKGQFNIGTLAYSIPDDYEDDGDGRTIAILVGGGVSVDAGPSNGGLKINRANMSACATAFNCNYPFGFYIDAMMCEADTLMITVRGTVWCGYVGYLYFEGLGYQLTSSSKKNILLVTRDENTQILFGECIGEGGISNNNQVMLIYQKTPVLYTALLPTLLSIGQRVRGINCSGGASWGTRLNEDSPNDIIYDASGLSNIVNTIILEKKYSGTTNQQVTGFSPKHIFIHNASTVYKTLRIGMTSATISAGYSIYGATDNVYSIDATAYGNKFKVTILLFGKTFYIEVEPLYADYAQKSDLPVSILSPTGDTHTLLPCPVTYSFGEKADLSVTVTATTQYHFGFSCPSNAATNLSINGINGAVGDTVEAGKTYEVDVWAGIAVIKEMEVTPVT